jgi:hypothetical protein
MRPRPFDLQLVNNVLLLLPLDFFDDNGTFGDDLWRFNRLLWLLDGSGLRLGGWNNFLLLLWRLLNQALRQLLPPAFIHLDGVNPVAELLQAIGRTWILPTQDLFGIRCNELELASGRACLEASAKEGSRR